MLASYLAYSSVFGMYSTNVHTSQLFLFNSASVLLQITCVGGFVQLRVFFTLLVLSNARDTMDRWMLISPDHETKA